MTIQLTAAHVARFEEWRDKWIKIGLSTEPADFDKAEKAALKAYALCDLERPKVILRMGSPYGATVGGATALLMLRRISSGADSRVRHHVWYQVWQQGGANQQVRQQVDHQVWEQVDRQVRQQVDRQASRWVAHRVWWKVDDQIRRRVDHQIRWQIDYQIRQEVDWQVRQQASWQVWQQLDEQIRQQLDEQIRQQVDQQTLFDITKEGFNSCRGGSASWCAYVTFLRDVLGWRDPVLENFAIEEDLTTSCGWVWWHKDVLAIGDRPSEIHQDSRGRLHNESGPSIAYRDGWKLYHVHGVAVPDFVIECPETITIEHIDKEANAEVRRVMIARMGLERFIRESGLRPVHSDDFGTLYRKAMPGDEPLVVVKVVNSTPNPDGSRKEYFLRVPPTMRRAREAVAWTFGMNEREYRPAMET